MLNANSKIHASKSNPNLINNENVSMSANQTSNILSILNIVQCTILNLVMASGIPPSISIDSSATINSAQVGQSSNTISSDENLYRKNFYQDAKTS